MTTITILPDNPGSPNAGYRAVAGQLQSVGGTAGQALDALAAQLDDSEAGTLIVVQQLRPDAYFTAEQQRRLEELMARWRTARDGRGTFSDEDQAELDALVQAELRAAGERAAAVGRPQTP